MFTQILDFQAIDTDKISRIGAFGEKDEITKKTKYNLYINFDFTRLILLFKDEKSLDAAYNELFTDLNTKKNRNMTSKTYFPGLLMIWIF